MILAFTVERYLAVYLPTRLKQICTVNRARGICAVVLVTVAALICPHHVLYIRLHRDPQVCTIVEADEVKFSVMYAVESVLLRILPVGLIATLNVFIITRVRVIATNKARLRNQK